MHETGDHTQHDPALFTDLYELTMAQAYWRQSMQGEAVFELFFRELPDCRNYIVAAGLQDVVNYLLNWKLNDEDAAYLADQSQFEHRFIDWLGELRFTGQAWAMPEGTPVFPDEPIVQIVAPISQAQIFETFILNQVHFQSVVASKAARVMHAAGGRTVVDFGSRRAHGLDAALKVARASYVVGGAGTSNVEAGRRYGIPIFGTMAHSYVQAHDHEDDAFEAFARQYPDTTLLVDTYDTLAGVDQVIELVLQKQLQIGAVRLDSGDLAELARATRDRLDKAGLGDVKIFASSGLDEHAIARLLDAGAPIDGFGPGTKLAVAPDATDLDMAYKLVAYNGQPRMKLSSDKVIYPGRKQVYRHYDEQGQMTGDTLGVFQEQEHGTPLLEHVIADGRPVRQLPTLEQTRDYCHRQLERLPQRLREFGQADPPYPVSVSDQLEAERNCLARQLR